VVKGQDLTDLTPEELWRKSDEFFHEGDYESCVRIERRIIELDPQDTEAYAVAAWLLWSMERNEECIALLEKGIRANPDNYHLYFELGFHYVNHLNEFDKGIPYLEQAVQHPPYPPYVKRALAHAYRNNGEYSRSVATWLEMRREQPGPVVEHNYRRALQLAVRSDSLALSGGVLIGPANAERQPVRLKVEEIDRDGDALVEERQVFLEAPTDRDGEPDYLVLYQDLNGDGEADSWRWMVTDADDDGAFDTDGDVWIADTDADGIAEYRQAFQDFNADGRAEYSLVFPNLHRPPEAPVGFVSPGRPGSPWTQWLQYDPQGLFYGWTGKEWRPPPREEPAVGEWRWEAGSQRAKEQAAFPSAANAPGKVITAATWEAGRVRASIRRPAGVDFVLLTLVAPRAAARPVLWQGYMPLGQAQWEVDIPVPAARFLFPGPVVLTLFAQDERGQLLDTRSVGEIVLVPDLFAAPAWYEIGLASPDNPFNGEFIAGQYRLRPPVFTSDAENALTYVLVLRDFVTGEEKEVLRQELEPGPAVYNGPRDWGADVAYRNFVLTLNPDQLAPERYYVPVQRLFRGEAQVDEKVSETHVLVRRGEEIVLRPRPTWQEVERQPPYEPSDFRIAGRGVGLWNLAEGGAGWEDEGPQGFSHLRAAAKRLGLVPRAMPEITAQTLQEVHVLVVLAPKDARRPTYEEVEAVVEWTKEQGSVLLLGGPADLCAQNALNRLASEFGLAFAPERLAPPDQVRRFAPLPKLPLFDRLRVLDLPDPGAVIPAHPHQRLLLTAGKAVLAVGEEGKAIALGSVAFANAYLERADNKLLALRLLDFLAARTLPRRAFPGPLRPGEPMEPPAT